MAVVMPGLERRLKAELSGDVQFDRFSRGRYATDASHYQIMPVGVVAPRTIEEAERAIRDCPRRRRQRAGARRRHLAGGQTVGESLVVDCSKYLTRILDLDLKARALHGRAGHRARRSQPPAQAARAVVSGRYLDLLARHHRRHGRQQFLRRPLDALRHHARQCALDRRRCWRTARSRISAASAAASTTCRRRCGRSPRTCWRSARAKPTRSPRASPRCSAGSAATISTRWCRARTTSISRMCWSARKARSAFPPASN